MEIVNVANGVKIASFTDSGFHGSNSKRNRTGIQIWDGSWKPHYHDS